MKNTLAPFDLEKALAGEPVVTRDGGPVKIAAYNAEARLSCQVVGWINGESFCWRSTGEYLNNKEECPEDLFMAPKPVEYFANIYRRGIGVQHGSKEDAIDVSAGALSICKLTILNGRVVSAETVHEY